MRHAMFGSTGAAVAVIGQGTWNLERDDRTASAAGMRRACEASLRRLRTDRLDVYLLHWPGRHALEDTIAGFEALVRGGKIRAWGVSNFDTRALAKAATIAGEGRVARNQVPYHLRIDGAFPRPRPRAGVPTLRSRVARFRRRRYDAPRPAGRAPETTRPGPRPRVRYRRIR